MSHPDELINDIQKGTELKHAETLDKSCPMIEKGATVHQSNRKQLLQEVEQPHNLQHPECTKDRSSPMIEEGAKVGKTERPALLNEIRHVKSPAE
ncbi:actobindin-like [Schistocerca gregaria]|uniref:actobindin-like n=1 Tax=Schistocerca gregaria TaxID=7010 RepID=UPI00211E4807|nr:actobindin-like [Schistocerca gregaria]